MNTAGPESCSVRAFKLESTSTRKGAAVSKGFVFGFITAILVFAISGLLFVSQGLLPAGQDQKPGQLETWAARTSLRATIGRQLAGLKTSLQPDEPTLTAGATVYVAHCLICHGGSDGSPSSIARGLAPDPPMFSKEGVEDDPEGNIYWKVAHGIRFTGMPSFRGALSETQLWQVSLFLKHMDKLPASTQQAWAAASARAEPGSALVK